MKKLVTAMILTMTSPAWADHDEQRDGFREFKRLMDFMEVRYDQPRPAPWSWRYVNQTYNPWQRDRQGQLRYLDDDWVRLDRFRTSSHQPKQQVIPVDRTVRGIGLTAMKRRSLVGGAWIEFANGRIVPVSDLTGVLSRGESFTREFKRPRHVKNLIVNVAPRSYRRAYLAVDLLPVEHKHKRRHHHGEEDRYQEKYERDDRHDRHDRRNRGERRGGRHS